MKIRAFYQSHMMQPHQKFCPLLPSASLRVHPRISFNLNSGRPGKGGIIKRRILVMHDSPFTVLQLENVQKPRAEWLVIRFGPILVFDECPVTRPMTLSEPRIRAKARRDPQGMACPFQGLQRSIGAYAGLPPGKAGSGHLPCCARLN
jgi:hypothetical protein